MPKGEQTKSEILAAAVEMASVNGLSGLTIGALARRTGLSKSGLFAHFGSKESLQTKTLEAAAERFVHQVVAPALAEAAGVPRIRALFENWLAWGTAEGGRAGCLFVAASIELDDQEGPVRDYLVWTQGEWLKILARAAERAVAAGQFQHDLDTRQFAHDCYSTMLGFHHARRLMRDPKAETRARSAFDRLLTAASI